MLPGERLSRDACFREEPCVRGTLNGVQERTVRFAMRSLYSLRSENYELLGWWLSRGILDQKRESGALALYGAEITSSGRRATRSVIPRGSPRQHGSGTATRSLEKKARDKMLLSQLHVKLMLPGHNVGLRMCIRHSSPQTWLGRMTDAYLVNSG